MVGFPTHYRSLLCTVTEGSKKQEEHPLERVFFISSILKVFGKKGQKREAAGESVNLLHVRSVILASVIDHRYARLIRPQGVPTASQFTQKG